MRLLINTLILLMLLALLAGVMQVQRSNQQHEQLLIAVQGDVARFQRQVALQAALQHVPLTDGGFPDTIDPAWFEEGGMPENALLDVHHPWLEIVNEQHRHLQHPPDRVATSQSQARFWYNPWTGIVRARVPSMPSDATALETYNFVNNADLRSLHEELPMPLNLD